MRIRISILLLVCVASVCAFTQTKSSAPEQSSVGGSASPVMLSGCLQGKLWNYQLIADSGHTHYLIGGEQALSEHVGDRVILRGFRDAYRDASVSDDGSSGQVTRFFLVANVAGDEGKCKNKQ